MPRQNKRRAGKEPLTLAASLSFLKGQKAENKSLPAEIPDYTASGDNSVFALTAGDRKELSSAEH